MGDIRKMKSPGLSPMVLTGIRTINRFLDGSSKMFQYGVKLQTFHEDIHWFVYGKCL